MADKLMHIPNDVHNITPSVDYNLWLKCLETQLNEIKESKFSKVVVGEVPRDRNHCLYFVIFAY